MLTTAEAFEAIQSAMPDFGTETVSLEGAVGRVLREDIAAERDQPPFDRVTMDGIAIRFAEFDSGKSTFAIQGQQHAGDPQQSLKDGPYCIEIMTGAVLPQGADCVIPVERIAVEDGVATLEDSYTPNLRQFIHAQATDYNKGSTLLRAGHVIQAVDVAVIASCGCNLITVSKMPIVKVISTGNELVAAGEPMEDHQIRMSNGPAVVAMMQTHGYTDCAHDHLVDDVDVLRDRLGAHLEQSDVLILSGGVSMGNADFVPAVLTSLGVNVVFHKISQRPGKPMWFGIGPGNQAVFALPGNPVSTLVCCRQYVIPALARAGAAAVTSSTVVVLGSDFRFAPKLTCFQPVTVASDSAGRLVAEPVATNTSGDFAALSGTDGYIELPLEFDDFPAGSKWLLHRWNSL